MQSGFNEKVTFKFPPCKPPESCLDYDYDPCESSDDITEKDLAVLLKEEKLKLQAEKENEAQQEAARARERAGQNELSDATNVNESLSKDKKALDKDLGKTEDKWTDEDEDQVGKKRVCKKFIKNPFFSNRLKFSSSNLPPPPPSPPPQFFPPVEETTSKDRINCLKKRRRCRKSEGGKRGRKDGKEDGGESDDGKEDGGESDDGKTGRQGDDEGKGRKNAWDDEKTDGEGLSQEWTNDDGKTGRGRTGSAEEKKRKRCVKPSDRPPCRKKESEISITLQPRQIPAAQRDLPPTCPKDIPEIERHIRIPCKKICKKKNK